jgi:hypothetical protein
VCCQQQGDLSNAVTSFEASRQHLKNHDTCLSAAAELPVLHDARLLQVAAAPHMDGIIHDAPVLYIKPRAVRRQTLASSSLIIIIIKLPN